MVTKVPGGLLRFSPAFQYGANMPIKTKTYTYAAYDSLLLSKYRKFGTTANGNGSPQDLSGVPPSLTHQVPISTKDLLQQRGSEKALDSEMKDHTPVIGEEPQVIMPHHLWESELKVEQLHRPVKGVVDFLAYWTIRILRYNFDWMSGWNHGPPTVKKAINRIVFLESVAGVPGSIGAIIRHLASLRRMKRDNGWINTLWAEAENERMHLLSALQLKKPGLGFRIAVFASQGVFFNFYFCAYIISPRFCHRLVGYLEEEAVKTYTAILKAFDEGAFPEWKNAPAPPIAKAYWKMPENATVRDMIEIIRVDEAHHRDVNHTFGDLESNSLNPYRGRGY